MENNTARDFVLQLGSLISLYLSLSFLMVLVFSVINLAFPDQLDNYWEIESAQQSARIAIAMLVVFFPTYLLITRKVNQMRRQSSAGGYLALTKWLIYLSLLIAALTLLIDLVIVITTFLEGEITARFILKALSVFVVVGLAFYYYLCDAKGYWLEQERYSKWFGAVTGAVVLSTVLFGFSNINNPSEVRERKLDEAQVSDLQQLQWLIQDYVLMNETLPESLEAIPRTSQYIAAESRADFRYEVDAETGEFALCAEFAHDAPKNGRYDTAPPFDRDVVILNNNDWYYEAGEWCFDRTLSDTE